MVRVLNKWFGTKSYFLGLGGVKNWWDFNDHESMIHDIGDRTRKRYYLIWDKNINSGDQGRRDMHQQMQNKAMIAKCIIWWCAWRIHFGPILLRPIWPCLWYCFRLTKKCPTAILIPFFTWVLESELLVSVSNRHFQRADSNFFCMFVTVSLLVCICVFLSVSLTLRVLFCVWRQDAPWVRLQKVGACRWQPSTRWQITTQLRQTLSHTNYTK